MDKKTELIIDLLCHWGKLSDAAPRLGYNGNLLNLIYRRENHGSAFLDLYEEGAKTPLFSFNLLDFENISLYKEEYMDIEFYEGEEMKLITLEIL